MGVTVDTSVLIDSLAGERESHRHLANLEDEGNQPVLNTITGFEALLGIEFTASKSERRRLEMTLRRSPVNAFDLEAARKAAESRTELLRAGRSPGAQDIKIAGFALSHGHDLVTRDRWLATAVEALGLRVSPC